MVPVDVLKYLLCPKINVVIAFVPVKLFLNLTRF